MTTSIHLGPRIIIVGLPGSGKTTLAKELNSLLDIPWTKIDRLVLDQRGKPRPKEEVEALLPGIGIGDEWIVEGPWWGVPEHSWNRATTIIWLDYPRVLLIWRALKRAAKGRQNSSSRSQEGAGTQVPMAVRVRQPATFFSRLWGAMKWIGRGLQGHTKYRGLLRRYVETYGRTGTDVIVIGTRRRQREFMESVRNGLEERK